MAAQSSNEVKMVPTLGLNRYSAGSWVRVGDGLGGRGEESWS
jgi:hypothetical protein